MPHFSASSASELVLVHPRLADICHQAIKHRDFTVIEGFRSDDEQDELFRRGLSKLMAGESKHNRSPSFAVDLAPYDNGIDWENREAFISFGAWFVGFAAGRGVTLRWGGDWDGDWRFNDQTFHDLPHFELV